jgi:hypothetical protein
MVTVRTYWNPAEAALAKSLLDNYEIPCALLHENANLYARGAQFAVPVRLVVEEDDAVRAIHFLNGDLERAAEIEVGGDTADTAIERAPEAANRNPWELLMLAFYLFVPAMFVLRTSYSDVIAGNSWTRYVVARARITHFLSWLAILLAVALVVAYFQVRRSFLKSQTAK